jgi:hypothetical protein
VGVMARTMGEQRTLAAVPGVPGQTLENTASVPFGGTRMIDVLLKGDFAPAKLHLSCPDERTQEEEIPKEGHA